MTKDQQRAIKIAKIILINAFPVIGHFLFGWGLFEVALTYIIETFVIFMIFFIYSYFIAKKTRYPVPFAIIQLFFVIIPIGGFMSVYIFVAFALTEPMLWGNKMKFDHLSDRLDSYHLIEVIICFFIIEGISFALRSKRVQKITTIWYNIRKLLFVHVFIILFLILSAFIPPNIILQIIFLVSFKIMLDYAVENENFMDTLYAQFKKSKRFNRHLDDDDDD